MSSTRRSRLIIVTVIALIVLGGVVLKVHLEGTRALARAEEAWDRGDMDRAQILYLRAGRWYLPGNGVREHAAYRLLTMARTRTGEKNWPDAVSAYDDVRALYYGSSSLTRAGGEVLDQANLEMAQALAAWKLGTPGTPGTLETPEDLEARYLALLVVHDVPSPLWSLVMGLALLGWLGTLGMFAWRYDALGRRWPWPLAATACFGLWALSLWMMG